MGWVIAAAASGAWGVLVGWRAGYRDPAAYLVFAAAAGLAVGSAARLIDGAFPQAGAADRAIRIGIVAVAVAVGSTLAVGAIGRLTPGAVLAAEAVAFAAAIVFGGVRRDPPAIGASPAPVAAIAIPGALLAFALAFAAAHAPFTLYDSLSYHLFFAARWVQDHAIAIIPTPFSDVAQAYAPGNGEAFFAWLMLPFHGDLFARFGQLPFGLLAALILYALARRAGAPGSQAVYPAAFFLLSRPIVEQIVGSNVDLVCAALFAASIYLGIAAVDRDERRDWALCGVAVGLYCGTKYLSLVYVPVLLILAFACGLRRRMAWALPGIAAFGLPWYLRNWAIAGSPIYPSTVTLAGVTIARGAFDRTAMLNTVFHTRDLALFAPMAAHAVGPALTLVWIPFAIAGWIAMGRRGWWPAGVLVLLPLLIVPLEWLVVPVNTDSRFLMPAVGPALLPLAFAFPRLRWGRTAVHILYGAAMIWLIVGVHAELPAKLPWFMGGWLALDGLLAPPFLAAGAGVALALALAVLWWGSRRRPAQLLPLTAAAIAVAACVLTVAVDRCAPDACAYLDTTSPFIRPNYLAAWDWIAANVHGATIAYTGINLPYPLTGPRLTNRVMYVNIDGRLHWRFHDYDRAFRSRRFAPSPPLLAKSSGELMSVAERSGPRSDALRPRYERMTGIKEAWGFNLEQADVRYLFVAALSAYEIDYVWHNDRGFPIEDEWANADPSRFHLVYANPQVRIYAVDTGKKAQA